MKANNYIISLGALLAGLVPVSANAIITSDQPGSHIVTPGQPAFGLDLAGVAMVGGLRPTGEPVSLCTGALVSDRNVLCAAHCLDTDFDGEPDSQFAPFQVADMVVFDLDGGRVAIEYQIQLVQFPDIWPEQSTDIAVITLNENAPDVVPRYTLYGRADEVGETAVLTGYGRAGHGSTGDILGFDTVPTKRAGLNHIEAVRDDEPGVEFLAADFDSGLEANNILALTGFDSDLGFGVDEVGIGPGDSGGPMFIGGAIAGINAYYQRLPIADVNGKLDSSWGEGNFFTRVSNYRSFIVAATNGTAVFVPEPSTVVLLSLGGLIVVSRVAKNRC